MEDSTAEGLAGGGALLAAVSLALPWYAVRVDGRLSTMTLGHASGWEALDDLHWLVLALALVTGWRAARALRPELPVVAAVGLLLLVGLRWASPPSGADAIASQLPDTSSPLGDAFARTVVDSISEQIGLELHASYGLAVAVLGAGAALAGALNRSRARAPASRPLPAR